MKKKTITGLSIVVLLIAAGAGLILLHRNQAFADPPDTPPGQENSEKVTICHIPPGNPGQAKKMEIPRAAVPAHLAHGDTYGRCFVKVEEFETESPIEDFRLDEEGNIRIIQTADKLLFFNKGQKINEVKIQGKNFKGEVFLSRTNELLVADCVYKNDPSEISCRLINEVGMVVNQSEDILDVPIALIGSGLLMGKVVSESGPGTISLFDLVAEEVLWTRKGSVGARLSDNSKFLLTPADDDFPVNVTVVRVDDGNILSQKVIPLHGSAGISNDGELIYSIIRIPSFTGLKIFDSELNQLNEWNTLPPSEGIFFKKTEEIELFVMPLASDGLKEDQLFLADMVSGVGEAIQSPEGIFLSGILAADTEENAVFILAGDGTHNGIVVFNPVDKQFKTEKFFNTSSKKPGLEINKEQNIVAISLTNRIKFFRYDF